MELRQNQLQTSSGLNCAIVLILFLCINHLSAQCVHNWKYKVKSDSISFKLEFIDKNILIMKLEYNNLITWTRPSAFYEDTFYIIQDSTSGSFRLEATDSSDFNFRCYLGDFIKLPNSQIRTFQLQDSIGYQVRVTGVVLRNGGFASFYGLLLNFSNENIPIGFDLDVSGHSTYGFLLTKHQTSIIRDIIKSGCKEVLH